MKEEKFCGRCKRTLPIIGNFKLITDRRTKDNKKRPSSWCNRCNAEYQAEWYQRKKLSDPDHYEELKRRSRESGRKYRIKLNSDPSGREKVREKGRREICKKYGLTIEEYEQMSAQQNHVCKICLKGNSNGNRLYIDHCHKSGVVRGLLCNGCNIGISALKECPIVMQSAIKYIEDSRAFINA